MPRVVVLQVTVPSDCKDDDVLAMVESPTWNVTDVRVLSAPHVIASGSVTTGFEFVGPFMDFDSADEYGETSDDPRVDDGWSVVSVEPPRMES